MHLSELLDQLLDLARAADLEVREVRTGQAGEGEVATRSGICRLKDTVWVLLVATDGIEERIEVLAEALSIHAGDFLESRYLPPAIRDRLGAGRGAGFGGA